MEWTCEKTSAPEEGDGWELLYKMVPADPPHEGYPDYRVGRLYRDLRSRRRFRSGGRRASPYWAEPPYGGRRGDPYSYSKGFHASPCYALCEEYVETTKGARYLKVLLHVTEESSDKKVGDQLYVLEEQALSEIETTVTVHRTPDGAVYHTQGLRLHRKERDEQGLTLPALIHANGTREWWRDGKRHRDDRDGQGHILPAVIDADGTRKWYRDGKPHRDDRDVQGLVLPAVISADGTQYWCREGRIHRDDRDKQGLVLPAMVRDDDGMQRWYRDGKLHRDDRDEQGLVLPAMVFAEGPQYWYCDGKQHRDDRDEQGLTLPAVVHANGSREWWREGRRHRSDLDGQDHILPAVIKSTAGREYSYRDGVFQGVTGEIRVVIGASSEREWWLNGERVSSPS